MTSNQPPSRSHHTLKECGCGRAYSRESWNRLPVVAYFGNGRDVAGEVLEMKNCSCGSSIAIDLGDEPDSLPAIRVR